MAQVTVTVCTFAAAQPQQKLARCTAKARALPTHQLRAHLLGRSQPRNKPHARGALSVTNISAWIPSPPPEPIKFPRARLNQRFAVLLMRSVLKPACISSVSLSIIAGEIVLTVPANGVEFLI
eukprot:1189354-Prorocentrum_minimum.AAC.8